MPRLEDAPRTAVPASASTAMLQLVTCAALAQNEPSQPIRIGPREDTQAPPATQPASAPETTRGTITNIELSGAPLSVQVVGDQILILGEDSDVAIIEEIFRNADQGVPRVLRFFKLNNAKAQDLARAMTDVFRQMAQRTGQQARDEDKVEVVADTRSNSLFIVASEKWIDHVMELIEQADATPSLAKASIKAFPMANRLVKDVKPVLEPLIQNWIRSRGGEPNSISINVDEATNTVFVTGGEKDLEEIDDVIQIIDTKPDDKTVKIGNLMSASVMLYPLRNAKADTLSTLLTELLTKAKRGETPLGHVIRTLNILDDQGNEIVALDLDRPTFVFGDPETNTLVMGGPPDILKVMKAVVERFDTEPLRNAVAIRIIKLHHADATELSETLKTLLQDGKKLTAPAAKDETRPGIPEGGAALVYNAVLNPDARTNTLFVAGTNEAVKLIEQYVEEVDRPGVPLMPIELIGLKHAAAASIEPALNDLMTQRAQALPQGQGGSTERANKVIIKVEAQSNALIISARRELLDEVKNFIAKLDVPGVGLVDRIITIQLVKGNAVTLAQKLTDIWNQRAQSRESGGARVEKPVIASDERSNSLIVAATTGDVDAISRFVADLEALPIGGTAEIQMIKLEHNAASALVQPLSQLFDERAQQRSASGQANPSDRIALQADPVTNSLLVAASPENYELVQRTVKDLDVEAVVEGAAEVFMLKSVLASRVKESIDNLFQGGIWKKGAAGDSSPVTQAREKVTVVAETYSNAVIVSASPENMSTIRNVIRRMDSSERPWTPAVTQIFEMTHADAVKVGAILTDYFEKLRTAEETGNRTGVFIPAAVFVDERTNRVIVSASSDGVLKARALIERLDVPPGEPSSVIRVYPLQEGSAANLAPMLESLFNERNQSRAIGGTQAPEVPFKVEADQVSNTLLVTASRDDHALIEGLLNLVDKPTRLFDKVRLFPLRQARAQSAKTMIDELYQSRGSGGQQGAVSVAVTIDERANSLVVVAPPGEMESIASLIQRIDTTEPGLSVQVRVIPLENADATKTSELLNNLMTGTAPGGGGAGAAANAAMLISYFDKDPYGQEIFRKTIRENVQVFPDERTNSVIVMAPSTSVELLEALVANLDQIKKRTVMIKAFTLRHADAQSTIDLLEKVFAQDERSQQQQEFQQGRELQVEGGSTGAAGPVAQSQGGRQAGGTFGKPRATFTPDMRTNSVIVAGWPEDIQVAADIIHQLDAQNIQERVHLVYALANTKAEDVQTALEQFYQAETQRLGQGAEGISEQFRREEEVSIVPHVESNQLLISVAPRKLSQVETIVRQLDTPPPQVMIQVLLAEVTLDESLEMGLEYSLQQLRFSEGAVAGPNGTVQGGGFDVVGGTDLGAAGSGGLGGFTFTITGEDFNFLLRALQTEGRLEVLQRPSIMVQNNLEANITVGQNVPFVRGSQTTDSGQVNAQVEYQEVGIKLDVTPNINPDGWVYLQVRPEISAITDSSVPLGNGINAPIFTQRSAETTVVVKDGETVIIGGLIVDSVRESVSKIPLLGDLPAAEFFGFRTLRHTKQRNELLIVLTPRVVRTVEDARLLSIEERDKSKITPKMKQSPLMERLRVIPEGGDELGPDEVSPAAPTRVAGYEDPRLIRVGPVNGGASPAGARVSPYTPAEVRSYGPVAPLYGPVFPVADPVQDGQASVNGPPDLPLHSYAAPVVVERRTPTTIE
ncbi:MAG: hypothetical protein HUU22_04280 [Phycisphaerae bacterium]|nr:hypothetical protein [Phycisphaerae bacterium]